MSSEWIILIDWSVYIMHTIPISSLGPCWPYNPLQPAGHVHTVDMDRKGQWTVFSSNAQCTEWIFDNIQFSGEKCENIKSVLCGVYGTFKIIFSPMDIWHLIVLIYNAFGDDSYIFRRWLYHRRVWKKQSYHSLHVPKQNSIATSNIETLANHYDQLCF